jgi:hypothetical protein
MLHQPTMNIDVRGIFYYSDRGALIPEETIALEREPDNEHDKNAVKVLRVHSDTGRKEHVGYVQHEKAEEVSTLLLEKDDVRCKVIPPIKPIHTNCATIRLEYE